MNKRSQKMQIAVLLAVTVGMFGFAFALVPLYDVFCELTGINGKTAASEYIVTEPAVTSERMVTVQFVARVGNGLPWEFRPTAQQLQVQVGKIYTATYYVRNRATRDVHAQAIPSVAPGLAATHLRKIECFCFEVQTLAAGEAKEMPVRFLVDSELPNDIATLSLSYTMFLVDAADSNASQDSNTQANGNNAPDTAQELRL
jgi:cytochrome c oxidase assembly protein subunit 11